MAMVDEIPSDNDVIKALVELGDGTTAQKLCRSLMDSGHSEWQSQIAIQRAAERGKIVVNDDWTLSASRERVAA